MFGTTVTIAITQHRQTYTQYNIRYAKTIFMSCRYLWFFQRFVLVLYCCGILMVLSLNKCVQNIEMALKIPFGDFILNANPLNLKHKNILNLRTQIVFMIFCNFNYYRTYYIQMRLFVYQSVWIIWFIFNWFWYVSILFNGWQPHEFICWNNFVHFNKIRHSNHESCIRHWEGRLTHTYFILASIVKPNVNFCTLIRF